MQTEVERSQTEPTVESAILEELTRASVVAATELKQRVGKRIQKLPAKRYKSGLDALLAAHRIHGRARLGRGGKPTKTVESYVLGAPPPPEPPARDLAPKEVLRILESGRQAPDALKKRVNEKLPALAAKDYSAVLAELIEARQIHVRRKRDKNGRLGKSIECYAIGAPTPDSFVEPLLAKWREMLRAAKDNGFDEQAFVAAALAALEQEGVPVQAPGSVQPAADDRAEVLRGVRGLVAREGNGALIPIRQLRGAVRLAKQRFDEAVLQLYADEAVILHHHDYVGSLSDEERNGLVMDKHGNYYVGVALRAEH